MWGGLFGIEARIVPCRPARAPKLTRPGKVRRSPTVSSDGAAIHRREHETARLPRPIPELRGAAWGLVVLSRR